jgi:phosphoribosylamine--glycine ligase
MKALVIGSGGREHALVWKLKQSAQVSKLFCAPGNAGIEQLAELVPIAANDQRGLLEFAKRERIDLTVVGPEQPLVDGIVDLFRQHGLKVFGPTKAAARLEGSKVFAKEFMNKHGIPTAKHRSFRSTETDALREFVWSLSAPVVVKADGLAAGKGVIICQTAEEAIHVSEEIFEKKPFGAAGDNVVIEEYLEGAEVSFFVVTDGVRYAPLASAEDHKRILDGDEGKNTGGMGAYAPSASVTPEMRARILREIVEPTLKGMRSEGAPYHGSLFFGLMLTADGPKVLEYNCRFGDPETQVILPLIDGDVAELFLSVAEGNLDPRSVQLHRAAAVCVVMASRGYPDKYETGKEILGLDQIHAEDGVVVFHAGTKRDGSRIVTAGGRVLGVTAIGYANDLEGTIKTAYDAVGKIAFDGAYYRSDIGKKGLKRQLTQLPLLRT